jgi:hypothetical protein
VAAPTFHSNGDGGRSEVNGNNAIASPAPEPHHHTVASVASSDDAVMATTAHVVVVAIDDADNELTSTDGVAINGAAADDTDASAATNVSVLPTQNISANDNLLEENLVMASSITDSNTTDSNVIDSDITDSNMTDSDNFRLEIPDLVLSENLEDFSTEEWHEQRMDTALADGITDLPSVDTGIEPTGQKTSGL